MRPSDVAGCRCADQYYLPECISAWVALEPTSTRNGTIWVQRGSHRRRLLVRADFDSEGEYNEVEYNEAVRQLCEENAAAGLEEEPVMAGKGDVLFFSGATHAANPASAAQ